MFQEQGGDSLHLSMRQGWMRVQGGKDSKKRREKMTSRILGQENGCSGDEDEESYMSEVAVKTVKSKSLFEGDKAGSMSRECFSSQRSQYRNGASVLLTRCGSKK